MRSLREIQAVQAPLVRQVAAGRVYVLREVFAERIAEFPHRLQHDELITVGLFDDLLVLPPDAAFRAIPVAVEVAAAAECPELEGALELLLALARASDTTEVPPELRDSWSVLAGRASGTDEARDLWKSLAEWYRADAG